MLDRMAEWILSAVNSVPIMFGTDVHNAELIRTMVGLLLIVLVIYVVAMRPIRTLITRYKTRKRETRGS